MSQGQGGPQWVPGGDARPDWNALATDADRKRARKRWTVIGTSVGAAALIGVVVALAIVNQGDDQGGGGTDAATTLPETTEEPDNAGPTFGETSLPPLPSAREFISDAEKDIAPFDVAGFYGEDALEAGDRSYAQVASDATESCADFASGQLATLLEEQGCTGMLRATYAGGGVAVTVGVAQLPSEEAAVTVHTTNDLTGTLQALPGGDAGALCDRGGCRATRNQVGRYLYLTIAGNADGTPDGGDGTPAQQAARDGNDHAFAQIIRRGEAQASASASAIVEERQRARDEADE
ncbi:hypothetical protein RM844_15975 [Streptomyces sp. DSM 44915]|uniref:Uncharacterized protein n=1 Tax=Streptomyces chisholmiae TaxID=3075540 RepID=A0ABU2JS16_9ACTN|nr:hypothetical protein [Streptomyces sp. DSM 44915]MDT0267783.1 hypothetical protein [Streptomyces sp. DSM 44915]